jgi:hypothetical protein
MEIQDSVADLDPQIETILVVFNANTSTQTLTINELAGANFALHPVQQNSVDTALISAAVDNTTGAFTVPARSTAVFVVMTESGSSSSASSESSVSTSSSSSSVSTSSEASESASSSSRAAGRRRGGGAFGDIYDLLLLFILGLIVVKPRRFC